MKPAFGVLGPLLTPAGTIGATKHRILLASLLMRPGEPVSVEELTGYLWDFDPPARPKAAIQTYVKRLRQVLGAAVIRTSGRGYQADVAPESVDVFRFRELVRAAQLTGADRRVDLLGEALILWRGQPFGDVPSSALRADHGIRLTQERVRALELRFTAELDLGRSGDLVAELRTATAENPLHEEFWALLMLALYRAGRQAEALEAFAEASRVLAVELSVGPGHTLRELHQKILTGDVAPAPHAPTGPVVIPSQLPLDIPDFVGRAELLQNITELLRDRVPVVISGLPGVGKTALAIRLGNLTRALFPDGQLYANLRGFSASSPATREQVMSQFLRGLGVPSDEIPADPTALRTLYQKTLAGRQMLLVLDNAASVSQIRDLLPNSGDSATLITSRNELPELQDSHRFTLDVLTGKAANDLLARMLGRAAVDSAKAAAEELATLCAHLPLAIRIAAANILDRRTGITAYVTMLRAENRVAALAVAGDEQAAVQATFDLSYVALSPEAQNLFPLLSVIPGPDFAVRAAASLSSSSESATRVLMIELATANLVQQNSGRYYFHDLIQLYARGLLQRQHSPEDQLEIETRLYEFYLHNTNRATDLLYPGTVRLPTTNHHAENEPTHIKTKESAHDWLAAELTAITTALEAAAGTETTKYSWLLADSLHTYLTSYRHSLENLRALEVGLTEARKVGDRAAEAVMLEGMGNELLSSGDYELSIRYLDEARNIHKETEDRERQATAASKLALSYLRCANLQKSDQHSREALDICVELNHKVGQSYILGNLAAIQSKLGAFQEALDLTQRSIALSIDLGVSINERLLHINKASYMVNLGLFNEAVELLNELMTQDPTDRLPESAVTLREWLARAEASLGNLDSATALVTHASKLTKEKKIPWLESRTLLLLAEISLERNQYSEASTYCRQAAEIATQNRYTEGVLLADLVFALSSIAERDFTAAVNYATRGLQFADKRGFESATGKFHLAVATAEYERGRHGECQAHANQALQVCRRTGQRPVTAQTLFLLGKNSDATRQSSDAKAYYRQSLELFTEMGMPQAAEVSELLTQRGRPRT
ncbi:tetratricopeptide repeat protein [Crossiella sp. SN42]|uniref:AfsR/SARP family transcriptional regulator n=1 Tax=Crossiella sp. SN42 TaxID=2944808 RepID=UPI00207CB219|nr:BTAD domain-containing putative transcriptional regulator [Crossiella sp. SN42]MCO1576468.1 tetratricopeptide repeat protein [Crossiella sp. SN42]